MKLRFGMPTVATFLVVGIVGIGCARIAPAAVVQQGSAIQQLIASKEFEKAEAELVKLVSANPKAYQSWFQLGSVRYSMQKWEMAKEAFLQAAGTGSPVQAQAFYNLACVACLTGEKEEGISYLSKAVAAGFSDRGLLATDTDLDLIRDDSRFAKLLPPVLPDDQVFAEKPRIIYKLDGEGPGQFGWIARQIGDLDKDGVLDFVTTAPTWKNSLGKVYVYSGKSGKLLFEREGRQGSQYGFSANYVGDVNGDGTPDVITSGMVGRGYVEVLSGKDGSVIHTLEAEKAGLQFGLIVHGIGDANDDGHADFIVTAPKADGNQPGSGKATGYSGKDGSELFVLFGEKTGDNFGVSAASDGKVVVIGAKDAGDHQGGEVYVYDLKNSEPKLKFSIKNRPESVELGMYFVSLPGDTNDDGVGDIFCVDFSDSKGVQGGGRVLIASGTDGSILLNIDGKVPGENLGTSISNAGDVDGDGAGDLVVGAWQNSERAPSAGKCYVFSGRSGKVLETFTARQAGDTLGFDAQGIGDVDGDGAIDFLLTSAWSNVKFPQGGRVFVVAGKKY